MMEHRSSEHNWVNYCFHISVWRQQSWRKIIKGHCNHVCKFILTVSTCHHWLTLLTLVKESLAIAYTLCLKKVPTFKLSVTLAHFNRFSKFLHCWKVYEICYKPHLTLGMLLHYLGKLKSQIFCRCGRKCKLHFNHLWLCYSSINFHIFGV